MKFLDGLDRDLKEMLLANLRVQWSHSSTAIEGNTLTLGETFMVLSEGLTISSKPLKDHLEVVGHAKAVDLVYHLLDTEPITKDHLFKLHTAVQTENLFDVYKPIGEWKNDLNSTAFTFNEKVKYHVYPNQSQIPQLMESWLERFNQLCAGVVTEDTAVEVYSALHTSFVNIHPFADGNGRMARLLANIPLLRAGQPPLIIPAEKRIEYLTLCAGYSFETPLPTSERLITSPEKLVQLTEFFKSAWLATLQIIEEIREHQESRKFEVPQQAMK
ncbi:MAG: Fic family protein [Desulfuromonadaceae bacterium]|nr:Fic family protein [Desulfuromonadaceae bacterium]MDD2855903.1 Fic family protein [Desulfuromonadaceae bacterium]